MIPVAFGGLWAIVVVGAMVFYLAENLGDNSQEKVYEVFSVSQTTKTEQFRYVN